MIVHKTQHQVIQIEAMEKIVLHQHIVKALEIIHIKATLNKIQHQHIIKVLQLIQIKVM